MGTHAGSTGLGAIIAWFTLKGKVERHIAITHESIKTIKAAVEEIKATVKEKVDSGECDMCKINSVNQFKAIDDKLDLLLERRMKPRE